MSKDLKGELERSLMKIWNRMGPRILPWGYSSFDREKEKEKEGFR